MLTDIFAYRYQSQHIWQAYGDPEMRLLNQSIAIAKDAIPYHYPDGTVNVTNKAIWKSLHDLLARELGVTELAPRYYSYSAKTAAGLDYPVSGAYGWDYMCTAFVTQKYIASQDVDRFIKERISFVELALRHQGEFVADQNSMLDQRIVELELDQKRRPGLRLPGSAAQSARTANAKLNTAFQGQVNELNERFKRAGVPLNYHNGFIQFAVDHLIESQIAKPFWDLVADPIWVNVDVDMKEALDRRDSGNKDPAIFAAKALESAIKIVSDKKGWTRSSENGASAYVDNLMNKANGYLDVWEGEMLKDYFRKVRNSVNHGPGSDPMPEFSLEQTDWAIDTAMAWVRRLARSL